MPVKIISRSGTKTLSATAKPATTPEPSPVVKKAPASPMEALKGITEGRPQIGKVIKFGKSEVRPDIDLLMELGKDKFMVHLKKPGIWYRIIAYDEAENRLKLKSTVGTTFDSPADRTVPRNYMVVVEPAGATAPNPDAVLFVQSLLSKVTNVTDEEPEQQPEAESLKKPEVGKPAKKDEKPPKAKSAVVTQTPMKHEPAKVAKKTVKIEPLVPKKPKVAEPPKAAPKKGKIIFKKRAK